MSKSTELLFWSKVVKREPDECWLWTGCQTPKGYGRFAHRRAHRMAYEYLVGPIPEGLVIDHLCRVRHCVNPAHMEVVTAGENVLRGIGVSAKNRTKTHCPQGHPLDGDNLYVNQDKRMCRKCGRERWRKWYAKGTRRR